MFAETIHVVQHHIDLHVWEDPPPVDQFVDRYVI